MSKVQPTILLYYHYGPNSFFLLFKIIPSIYIDFQVQQYVMEVGDGSSSTIDDLRNNLKEKNEEMSQLECLSQALIFKERIAHKELLDSRKEMIDVSS